MSYLCSPFICGADIIRCELMMNGYERLYVYIIVDDEGHHGIGYQSNSRQIHSHRNHVKFFVVWYPLRGPCLLIGDAAYYHQ